MRNRSFITNPRHVYRYMSKYGIHFKDHDAKVVVNNNDFLVIDWRNKSGSSEYYVRYILDIQRGTLIIQGDLGECMACWYNPVRPEDLKGYIKDAGYFVSKFRCSTDKYTYAWEDIVHDLYEYRDEFYLQDCKEWERDEIISKFEAIKDALDWQGYAGDEPYSDDVVEAMSAVTQDWWDSPLAHLGRRISGRVYLWIIGYQMACGQLGY